MAKNKILVKGALIFGNAGGLTRISHPACSGIHLQGIKDETVVYYRPASAGITQQMCESGSP